MLCVQKEFGDKFTGVEIDTPDLELIIQHQSSTLWLNHARTLNLQKSAQRLGCKILISCVYVHLYICVCMYNNENEFVFTYSIYQSQPTA